MNNEKYTYSPVSKLSDSVPVWLCFPCEYSIGMSSLGYLTLFRLLDQNKKASPERVFLDTVNTYHSINDVELLGFSFSFDFDFLNIFKMLEKYNIDLRSVNRNEDSPLIFAGGPAVSANPEPFADFFDFYIIGDGEEVFAEVIDVVYASGQMSRREKLLALSRLEGVYVPSFYEFEYEGFKISAINKIEPQAPDVVKRAVVSNADCVSTPIITENTMFSRSLLVEVSRGCPNRCGFCLASYLNLPVRFPKIESIKNEIEKGLKHTDKVGLLGALIAAHPDFDELCKFLLDVRKQKEIEVSVSSLRADRISPLVVKMLVACGQRTSTIAVEAGSERLRKLINKDLSEDQVINSIETARNNGLVGMKIYGMIGLPTETQDDIWALINLMKKLKMNCLREKFSLTLSVSSYVPKAQTPFQWLGRENSKIIDKRNNLLKKELHKLGIKFRPTSVKWDYTQAVLSRGDRRIAPILEKVYKFGGSLGSWGRAFKEAKKFEGLDIPDMESYAYRNFEDDEILPWDLIFSGVSKEKLLAEKNRLVSL